MDNWLKGDPKHVAVVHCLGGKGRTGTVIACYLRFVVFRFVVSALTNDVDRFRGDYNDPMDALDHFAQKRSKIENGVKQASQKRYVSLFEPVIMY